MQDLQTRKPDAAVPSDSDARPTPLPLRNDTILGVCEAIGTDFGFHPNWLRAAFAGATYINPIAVIGVYLALGLVVSIARWIAPAARPATAAPQLASANQAPQDNRRDDDEVPLAA